MEGKWHRKVLDNSSARMAKLWVYQQARGEEDLGPLIDVLRRWT
jgi:hypothetical protein